MRISDWSSDVCSSDLGAISEPLGRISGWGTGNEVGAANALYGLPGRPIFWKLDLRPSGDHPPLRRSLMVRSYPNPHLSNASRRFSALSSDFYDQGGMEESHHSISFFYRNAIGRASCRERVWQYVW